MIEENSKPNIGMKFDNLEDARSFWVAYGGKSRFGVRKDSHTRSKKDNIIVTSQIYVCSKEGCREEKKGANIKNPRAETRTGCMARMVVKRDGDKYTVYQFIEAHNHVLHTKETSHMLPSQRKISEAQAYEIELAEDSGLRQKACFDLMSMQAGGRASVRYTRVDVKNYLRSRRQRNMAYGNAGVLFQYFQKQQSENSSFFHACQMDSEEYITNVFWADAMMCIDYGLFGDVVTLDTTFGTNKKCNTRKF